MRRLFFSLAALLSACSLIAPFGQLETGDGSVVGGDGGVCLMRPMTPTEEPLPMGAGTEVCNREDDDGDGLFDSDTLTVEAARTITALSPVLDARGMRGSADDRVAVVASVGDGVAESLRLAEVTLAEGFDPLVSTLVEGEVLGFDGARVRDGYAIAFSLDGDLRIGVARDCDLGFGESVISIASGTSSRVRVEALTPVRVLVTWAGEPFGVAAAIVDVQGAMPAVEAMHPSLLADLGYTAGHDPDAWSDADGNAIVAFAARTGESVEGVFFRAVGGTLGAATTVALGGGFYGDGPFGDPHGVTSSTGAMWVPFDEATPSGAAYVSGSAISARRYGPPVQILGLAATDTPDVGVLMDFSGTALVERTGPEVAGNFSQDMNGPVLAPERWRDLIGVPRGRTRYVAVATRPGGAVVTQRVGCFD